MADISLCPSCSQPVVLAAIQNQRNGKWTILPLDKIADEDTANFVLLDRVHEAVDIMGNVSGPYPVAELVELSTSESYRTHPPSHYLEAHK
jgi:hypothetical protein